MRKDFLLGIGATFIAMALFYFADHSVEPLNIGKNKIDSEADLALPANRRILGAPGSDSRDIGVIDDVSVSGGIAPGAGLDSSGAMPAVDREAISRQFAAHLKTMNECLKINSSVDHDQIEPTYDNLLVSLKPALGELVVQMDDWTQIDLQRPDGSRRRIRSEMNYDDPNNPVKYVQFYHINEQGFPELQNLDPDKARNPTDDYINYLRDGANTVLSERGSRAYFAEGEEIVLIERSGLIESFSLTKDGKSVSCTGLDRKDSNCQCQD